MDQRSTRRGGPLYWLGRRSRRFWIATGELLLPVLYIASFGPACWLIDRNIISEQPTRAIYRPIIELVARCDKPIRTAVADHLSLGSPNYWGHGRSTLVVSRVVLERQRKREQERKKFGARR
jgi:hypothetical protein